MRREFRGLKCVYCTVLDATTNDHVFNGKLFLEKDRGDLPKVPACGSCNGRKSAIEHELTTVLAFGGRHAAAEDNLTSNTPGRLQKNQKLHRQLARSLQPSFLKDGGSIYQKTSTVSFDGENLLELLKYIGRGLLWHHRRVYFGSEDDVVAIIETKSDSFVWKSVLDPSLNAQRVSEHLGNGTVVYEGHLSNDTPTLSIWHILLFGGVMLTGRNNTQDAIEVQTDWWVITGPASLLPRNYSKPLIASANS